MKRVLLGISLFLCFSASVLGAEKWKSPGGFLDFNFYPYVKVDGDNVFTLNALAKLPHRFHYFSLTNLSSQTGRDELSETIGFYSEQNLRWALPNKIPFDLTIQWNPRSGADNDRLRLGTRWRLHNTSFLSGFFKKIRTSYTINFHAIQFDHAAESTWQMEHVYRINFCDRWYLAAFGDHTFGASGGAKWVTEHQLGFRLFDWWYLVTEFRRNEYRTGKENSLGLGLEYALKF